MSCRDETTRPFPGSGPHCTVTTRSERRTVTSPSLDSWDALMPTLMQQKAERQLIRWTVIAAVAFNEVCTRDHLKLCEMLRLLCPSFHSPSYQTISDRILHGEHLFEAQKVVNFGRACRSQIRTPPRSNSP